MMLPDEFKSPAKIDPATPNIARVYDYLLGGKDNYEADRQHAETLLKHLPRARELALANRYFMSRAVRFLADEIGIRQFLDVGAGLPTGSNVHEVARAIQPDAHVVYVDNDPLVLVHGRALLADNGGTTIIQADMREPEGIISHPDTRRLIDFDEPVAVLFVSVLHFLSDEDDPYGLVDSFREVIAPGSFLVLSHGLSRPDTRAAAGWYQKAMGSGTPRTRYEIARFFDGFELVPPGLVPIPIWRPELEVPPGQEQMPFLGGVGSKPQ